VVVDTSGSPVSLVGWSLGGVIAREVARRRPEAVRRVVTYGTPVVGGPRSTAVARAYGPEASTAAGAVADRLESPIRVPLTVVFSRWDGIVTWEAWFDPDVWRIVADRLALTDVPQR
jgi:pimeloyl-ACP methyl ester carboxylesterase